MKQIKTPANFRDLGGIPGADGRPLKPCRLLRSGEPVGMSAEDKSLLLQDYHLRCMVDFRSSYEIKHSPDDIIPNVYYINIDLAGESGPEASSLENLEDHLDVKAMNGFMQRAYYDLFAKNGAKRGYRQFIDVLLEQQKGAVLFHCFAGKDRTGVAAAIILTLLDASKVDIMDDYMSTNRLRQKANASLLQKFKGEGMSQEELAAFEIGLNVRSDYLGSIYDLAEQKYGSFLEYIKQEIGVSQGEIDTLQNMYLD